MRTVALCCLVGLVSAPTAGGATVESNFRVDAEGERWIGQFLFEAAPGVANRLRVQQGSRHAFIVRETAEPLIARGECRRVDRHTARCVVPSDVDLSFRLGDGPDRARTTGANGRGNVLYTYGEQGNDVLRGRNELGGPGHDRLIGTPQFDDLVGGRGHDVLHGRASFDDLADGESDRNAAADVFDGGAGPDAISYEQRDQGLTIDLRRNTVGFGRTADRIADVERAIGTRGPDVLIGDRGENSLNGFAGDDRLYGRAGDDGVSGGDGDDRVFGGVGADRLLGDSEGVGADLLVGGPGPDWAESDDYEFGAPGKPFKISDKVRCDSKRDNVESDPPDRLIGCSRMFGWDYELDMTVMPKLQRASGVFTFRCGLTYWDNEHRRRCLGKIVLRSPSGTAYGSAPFDFPGTLDGQRKREVTVPLTRSGRRATRRGGIVEVEMKPTSEPGTSLPSVGYRVFMKRKR